MGVDDELCLGYFLAYLPQMGKVMGVYRQFEDGHVVGCVFRVRPSHDGVGSGVEDVLGVRAGKFGREGHVERVVDRGIDGLGGGYRRGALGSNLLVRVYAWHAHIRSRHAEVGAHPLGPVTHVCQLIHVGR